jgi:transposase InsO family protein
VHEVDVGWRTKLARALGLKRSSLYYHSTQVELDAPLVAQIKELQKVHKHYGYRRVALDLGIGKNRAQRLLRTYGLNPKPSPHQRHYKQHSGTRPAPPNILKDEHIVATRPNQVWAQDFTYLKCMGRWYYLSTVIDIFSREVVGWGMSIHHDTELILSALYDALSKQTTPVILHFDRGSEYLSGQHLDLVERLEIRPSASAPGSPWQNGFQERFYGSFKTELESLKDVQSEGELFEKIAVTLHYYNTKRTHTKLKTNPRQFRQNYEQTQYDLTGARDKVSRNSGS